VGPMLISWHPQRLSDITARHANGATGWLAAEVDATTGEAIFELADGTVVVTTEYLTRAAFDRSVATRTHPLLAR
jgi:hypothetical protein